MNGADRQWRLNRLNFRGRWCGPSSWYVREEGGRLDLEHPALVIADTCYTISFRDDDHGTWRGRGLRFAPGGEREVPLSRATYNRGGGCWQFPGAGGQSSLAVEDPAACLEAGAEGPPPRFGQEVNLFHARSRSMLIALYEPQRSASGPCWRLESLAAVPFRCTLAAVDPPRPEARPWEPLLAEMEGWPGTVERLVPGQWPQQDEIPAAGESFRAADFALHPLTAGFADGLLCSLPEQLPAGAFTLQVGCRFDAQRFVQVSLVFDAEQRLSAWEQRRFQRP